MSVDPDADSHHQRLARCVTAPTRRGLSSLVKDPFPQQRISPFSSQVFFPGTSTRTVDSQPRRQQQQQQTTLPRASGLAQCFALRKQNEFETRCSEVEPQLRRRRQSSLLVPTNSASAFLSKSGFPDGRGAPQTPPAQLRTPPSRPLHPGSALIGLEPGNGASLSSVPELNTPPIHLPKRADSPEVATFLLGSPALKPASAPFYNRPMTPAPPTTERYHHHDQYPVRIMRSGTRSCDFASEPSASKIHSSFPVGSGPSSDLSPSQPIVPPFYSSAGGEGNANSGEPVASKKRCFSGAQSAPPRSLISPSGVLPVSQSAVPATNGPIFTATMTILHPRPQSLSPERPWLNEHQSSPLPSGSTYSTGGGVSSHPAVSSPPPSSISRRYFSNGRRVVQRMAAAPLRIPGTNTSAGSLRRGSFSRACGRTAFSHHRSRVLSELDAISDSDAPVCRIVVRPQNSMRTKSALTNATPRKRNSKANKKVQFAAVATISMFEAPSEESLPPATTMHIKVLPVYVASRPDTPVPLGASNAAQMSTQFEARESAQPRWDHQHATGGDSSSILNFSRAGGDPGTEGTSIGLPATGGARPAYAIDVPLTPPPVSRTYRQRLSSEAPSAEGGGPVTPPFAPGQKGAPTVSSQRFTSPQPFSSPYTRRAPTPIPTLDLLREANRPSLRLFPPTLLSIARSKPPQSLLNGAEGGCGSACVSRACGSGPLLTPPSSSTCTAKHPIPPAEARNTGSEILSTQDSSAVTKEQRDKQNANRAPESLVLQQQKADSGLPVSREPSLVPQEASRFRNESAVAETGQEQQKQRKGSAPQTAKTRQSAPSVDVPRRLSQCPPDAVILRPRRSSSHRAKKSFELEASPFYSVKISPPTESAASPLTPVLKGTPPCRKTSGKSSHRGHRGSGGQRSESLGGVHSVHRKRRRKTHLMTDVTVSGPQLTLSSLGMTDVVSISSTEGETKKQSVKPLVIFPRQGEAVSLPPT